MTETNNVTATVTVYSPKIAESLIVDKGYFTELIAIRRNRKNPKHRTYIFRVEGNIVQDLNELIAESRKLKSERRKEKIEIGKAITKNEVEKNEEV
ncbi:MAG TPA: hypothetical protein DC024_10365 [Clostridiales bacterium]|nr:hypothetical protein [Clostridiales bacterium]